MTQQSGPVEGRKVLVIGIDGATLDLIEPWVAEGRLPNFARYFSDGAYGTLQSTLHPISPSAWVSFQTGTNPGKHGVLEFFETDLTARTIPVSSQSIMARPFWEHAGDSGKKVGIINVLGTYPVRPVNGFLVAGMLSPDQGVLSHPSSLLQELRSEIGDYIVDADASQSYVKGMSVDHFINTMMQMTELRAEAAKYLVKTKQWDLFAVVFVSTDRVQHYFWKYIDPNRSDVPADERDRYGEVILNLYQYLDSFIGEIDSLVDKDTVQLIISDHGFGPVYRDVNLVRWLYEHGYLYPKRAGFGTLYHSLKLSVRRNLPAPLFKLAKSYYLKSSQRPSLYAGLPYDWSRTKVFPIGHFGKLYVNLRGREPLGIVKPGEEYERFCQELTSQLLEWKNPENGEPLICSVYRREDIYRGPFAHLAPDLSIAWSDYAYTSYHIMDHKGPLYALPWRDEDFGRFEYAANHRPEGILLAKGSGIKQGAELQGAKLIDIAPTILHIMGLGVPDQMDGTVLGDLFDPDDRFLTRQVSFTDSASDDSRCRDGDAYSAGEVEQIEEHLRSLGYL